MYIHDIERLTRLCVDNGVLQSDGDHIFVYREAGSDPIAFPEGWYAEDFDDFCDELQDDDEGIRCLTKALDERGVDFQETDREQIERGLRLLEKMTASFGDTITFAERSPGEYWATPKSSKATKTMRTVDENGNISTVELDADPEFVRWCYDCAGMRFYGGTRDDAEQAMVRYIESTTCYRGVTMIAKHLGYSVYGVDEKGVNYVVW